MWKMQWKWLVGLAGGFLLCYWLLVGAPDTFQTSSKFAVKYDF